MKKMKFTLGLMLSMLILGASAGHEQTHNRGLPHNGVIETAMYVQGCDFYNTDITFKKMVKESYRNHGYLSSYAIATTYQNDHF